MTHAQEAVKTRHKETSLYFPGRAGSAVPLGKQRQSLPQWLLASTISCTYWYFKQRI